MLKNLTNISKDTDFLKGTTILFHKPIGWTSFDLVKKVRNIIKSNKKIKKIKVGHAGTLDPLADGLLIICTGRFTKKIEEIQKQKKIYTGEITLGGTTPSFDRETEINKTFETSHITEKLLIESCIKLSLKISFESSIAMFSLPLDLIYLRLLKIAEEDFPIFEVINERFLPSRLASFE